MSELDLTPPEGMRRFVRSDQPERIADPIVQGSEEEFDRSLRPQRLDEFTGQPRVKEQLRVFIDAAKQRGEPLDHALFAGPPGLGKCVTPDTMLFTPYGMVPIGSLGDLKGESWQPIRKAVAGLYGVKTADYFYNNGIATTVRVTTEAGYQVEGTANHPVLVRGSSGTPEFRHLSELRSGDCVAVRLNAATFGASTALHVEGVTGPSLEDPAVIPDQLTESLSTLLGLLLGQGRLLPDRSGFSLTSPIAERLAEVGRLGKELFCVDVQPAGDGILGQRIVGRSARVGRFLEALGLGTDGFKRCPDPVYLAPRNEVSAFVRGVFWGIEHAPACTIAHRTIAAHLQLILANLGMESALTRTERGYTVLVGDHHPRRHVYEDHVSSAIIEPEPEQAWEPGFGARPAGMPHHHSAGATALAEAPAPAGQRVSVAEPDPAERGRALTRKHAVHSDERALAVRSATATLRQEDAVEIVWEPIVSIQRGRAHTCDVSVPDGHTFVGNGIVCHNTTLASVVANELGSNMRQTSGPALDKKADIAAVLTSLESGDVLFIDEIHRLSTSVEEVLYSAMEDYQIDIVLGQGPAARTLRLDVAPFTLIGATTRTGLLTTPLRDRFGVIQRLEYYAADELQTIIVRSARLLDVTIEPEAAGEIARRSRGTPRIANRLLRRVRDVAQVRHQGVVTLEIAQEALLLVDIDETGLDRVDREILRTIAENFRGGPVGLSTLAVAIGEEPHTIEDVYEPFLLQQGLLQRTPRGRMITDLARRQLGFAPAVDGSAPLF